MAECLTRLCEALGLIPSTLKHRERERRREDRKEHFMYTCAIQMNFCVCVNSVGPSGNILQMAVAI